MSVEHTLRCDCTGHGRDVCGHQPPGCHTQETVTYSPDGHASKPQGRWFQMWCSPTWSFFPNHPGAQVVCYTVCEQCWSRCYDDGKLPFFAPVAARPRHEDLPPEVVEAVEWAKSKLGRAHG
jgi:hypothetical protein